MAQNLLRDGLVAFVKGACPTCVMIAPVMAAAAQARGDFQVVTQDDPNFPAGVANVVDDRALDQSWLNNIEATPTLIRYAAGREVERVMGWDRAGWQRLTGIDSLGADLPALKPG
ncbi:MAG: thioredoxin family protein [Betaproteobacteria bacterium]|nr:thioredoxin family protein [Betaproteobacteria bacterium]